jgi:hypothetical protein
MILLQIDANRVRSNPFERNSPRAVDGYGEALRLALQCVQPPPRQTQIIQCLGAVKGLKAPTNTFEEIRANAARVVLKEKVAQGFAAEADDHMRCVKEY